MDNKQTDAMMTLKQQCLSLPYRERAILCGALQESLYQEREDNDGSRPTSRSELLLSYMEEVIGEPIPLVNRRSTFVWARAMVVHQMVNEGYSTPDIAGMLMKTHPTIIYLDRKMQDALTYPSAHRDINEQWNEFQKRIQDDIHN